MSTYHRMKVIAWGVRLSYRFMSGRLMAGRKTDATFLRPASKVLNSSEHANRWEMMRGAARLAWRMGFLYLLLLAVALLLLWPVGIMYPDLPWYLRSGVLLQIHLFLILSTAGGYLLRRFIREYGCSYPWIILVEKEEGRRITPTLRRLEGRRDWRREKVIPIARSLSVIVGHSIPDKRAEEWIYVPKDYRDGGMTSIRLPAHFTGADINVQKRLVSSVSSKLGVPGMVPSWQLEGSSPRVLLSAPPLPPERLSFSDVKRYLPTEEYRPLLGVAAGGDPFHAEMIDDSPHVGLSAGSGAGKSTLAKWIIAQALSWGWGVIVLDWKQSGAFTWLGGLQGVTYLSRIDAIHDMGVRLAEEVDERKQNGMGGKNKILVVRDEWNVTAPLLYDYWTQLRSTAEPEDKKLMPLRSPALSGYAVLDFAGREYGLFDFCVAQRFSARIFNGNADIREVFGIKLLARYTSSTVKMLAPDIKPFPRKNNNQGRWVVVVGDEATVVQSPYLTDDEARSLAISGLPNPLFPLGTDAATQHGQDRSTLGDVLRPDATPSPEASSVVNLPHGRKLSELWEGMEHLGITHNVLRNASREDEKGDPDFPRPVGGDPRKGYRYSRDEVLEWARRRHAKMAVERGK